MEPKMTKLLTVEEVADLLRVGRSTAYSWISQGLLPSIDLTGGSRRPVLRVRREDLDAWIEQKAKPQDEAVDAHGRKKYRQKLSTIKALKARVYFIIFMNMILNPLIFSYDGIY